LALKVISNHSARIGTLYWDMFIVLYCGINCFQSFPFFPDTLYTIGLDF